MDADRLATEIANTEAIIDKLSAAILALADPTVKFYMLDSGQTVERVDRNKLPEMIETRQALQNELATLHARQTGSGVVTVIPAW